jgi:YD repeat-containing protein
MRGESPHSGGLRRKSHLDLLLVVLMVVFLWGCGMSVSAASATVPSTAIRYTYTQDSQLSAVIKPEAEYGLYTWDAAGNLSSVAKKSSTKLSIIQLEPSKGAVGETVDIWGTGFSTTPSNDTVKFHGMAATVSAATAYTLAVKVPSGATTGTVTVQTTTEGPVTSAQTFTVASAVGAPTITSLSTSVAEVGSTVTVSGTNFEATAGDDVVRVNQDDAEVVSASSTSIKFKVPGVTGGGHVFVSTPQGSVSGPVLYIPPEGMAASKVGASESISSGKSVTLKLSSAEKVGLAVFEGTAGQHVSVVLSEETMHRGWISVFSPQDSKYSPTEESFREGETEVDRLTIPVTGTYTILVTPEGTYTGSVKLSTVTDVSGSITPTKEGAKQAVSIGTPYQQARYTVAGTAGEIVSVAIGGVSFSPEGGEVEWVNSEGARIGSTAGFSASSGGFMRQVKFPATGIYMLVVKPYGVSTGSLTLTAYEAPDVTGTISPSAEGETKTVTTTVPGQYARLTFSGTEGERISMVLSEVSYGRGYLSIVSPTGETVAREYFYEKATRFIKPVKLPATGTYTILVEPTEPETASLEVTAYSVTDVTGSITPTTEGAKKEVSLKTPGQRALYTVSGTAGEIVSVNITGVSFPPEGGEVEWVNSEGARIGGGGFGASTGRLVGQVTFPTTGTYTLIVKPYEISTGSLTLTVYETPNVTGSITPTTEGETKTVTIGVPGQRALITFAGSSGQTITLKAQESTIAKTRIYVENSEGSKVYHSEGYFGSSITDEFTLSATETYTIVFEPEEADTGSLKLTAYLGSHPGPLVRASPGAQSSAALIGPFSPDGGTLRPAAFTVLPSAPAGVARRMPSALAANQTPREARRGRSSAHRATAAAGKRVSAHTWVHGALGGARGRTGGGSEVTRYMRVFRARGPLAWRAPAGGAWETGEPPSPWASIARLQAPAGASALSGQVLAQNGLPIAGVRVALEGTSTAARTDEAGRFLLSGVPAGHQVLVVEGEPLPGHTRYGTYEMGVDLTAGQTTVLPYTVWLTPLDPAGDHRIASPTGRETRITTPQIPGLEVRLPAGTVIHDAAGRVVRELNITAVPVDRPPFPLPFFSNVPLYFTVQPGRAYLSKGAQIIYPNYNHLPAGQRVDFWNYDPSGRGWYVYGQGTVTANRKQVVPDPGVRVWEFTGAMVTHEPKLPKNGTGPGAGSSGGDPVDLGTGLFNYRRTDLVIPDTIPIVIERTYRQGDSNSYSFGIGTTSLYDLRLWSENNYHEADLVMPDGGKVLYKRTSPGEGFEEAEYKATETPSIFYDSVLKWSQADSGWDLTLTNGTTYVFGENAPLEAIRNKQGQQLTITRSEGQRGNITQITSPHGRWVTFAYNSSNDITEIKDNSGRTLKYAYNKEGYLESATDPASRTTKYEYDTAGDMTSITDPRGNTYLKTEYNSNDMVSKQTLANGGVYEFSYTLGGSGNVESTTETEPRENKHKVTFNAEELPTSETAGLGSSVEEKTTFERQTGTGFLLSSTDARSRKTTYEYDSYGNITSVTHLAGTGSAQTYKYAYEPDTNELTKETDPLGHSTSYEYNSLGERTAKKDALGHTTHYEYNGDGQPTVITNPLGHKTTITYELGAPVAATDQLGRTTKQFVDAAGQVLATTLPGGQRTLYEYNNDNQITKMTDPLGNATTYEYDADGDLSAITDPLKTQEYLRVHQNGSPGKRRGPIGKENHRGVRHRGQPHRTHRSPRQARQVHLRRFESPHRSEVRRLRGNRGKHDQIRIRQREPSHQGHRQHQRHVHPRIRRTEPPEVTRDPAGHDQIRIRRSEQADQHDRTRPGSAQIHL